MKKSPPLYDDVLGYIAYLPFVATGEEILALLRLHGRALARNRAVVLSALLVKLCTGDYAALLPANHPAVAKAAKHDHSHSARGGSKETPKGSKAVTANDILKSFTHLLPADVVIPTERLPIAEVMYLFTADQASLLSLLEGFVEASPGRVLPAKVSTTLMEVYLQRYGQLSLQLHVLQEQQLQASSPTARGSATQSPPPSAQRSDQQKGVENALQVVEAQVMGLLDGAHAQYDPAHALLLCHSFGFERGQRFLLEKQQSTELLMRMLIQGNDSKEVFKVLRREGSKDPDLYIQVLTHFVQQSIVPEGDAGAQAEEKSAGRRREGSAGSAGSASSEEESEEEEDDEEEDEER
jgi:hypothetical protein